MVRKRLAMRGLMSLHALSFFSVYFECGQEDLKVSRCIHTWFNHQAAERWMRIKLDRVMGNSLWHEEMHLRLIFLSRES